MSGLVSQSGRCFKIFTLLLKFYFPYAVGKPRPEIFFVSAASQAKVLCSLPVKVREALLLFPILFEDWSTYTCLTICIPCGFYYSVE
jgi:hypothetical protein